jgi:hypothetical protein
MRVDLRDGQWAELREHITHGYDKAIKQASLAARANQSEVFDWTTIVVAAFVRAWNVRDPDGTEIPFPPTGDLDAARAAVERAPEDVVEALFDPAVESYSGATVPNAPTPPSSDAGSSASQ